MAIPASDIIARARRRTDKVSSTFIDDTADLVPWVDKGHRQLYDLLVNSYGPEYFQSTVSFRVTSGTTATTLTSISDCSGVAIDGGVIPYKIIRLDTAFDGIYRPMKPFLWNDSVLDLNTGSWLADTNIRYHFAQNTLSWQPVPGATHCVRLLYVPRPVEVNTTAINIHEQCEPWSEFIELYVSIAIRQKERDQTEVASLKQDLAMLRQHVIDTAPSKDIGQPQPIADHHSLESGGCNCDTSGEIW